MSTRRSGRATVAGLDVTTQAADVRRRIGLVGQYAALDEILDDTVFRPLSVHRYREMSR